MKRLDRAKRIDEKNLQIPPEDGSSRSDTAVTSLSPPPIEQKSNSSTTKIRAVPFLPCTYKDDYPNWTFEDANPLERAGDLDGFLQSVGLQKNEDFLVSPNIRTVSMGLGWARGADVDASVALFDEHLRHVDRVWYRQLKSHCGSVRHSGDNLTGIGEGDDEVISVELRRIPPHIHHLLFAVCVYSFQLNFTDVRSAFVRMVNVTESSRRHEVFRFSLTQMTGHAMIMGVLTRKGPAWSFKALGIPASGRNIQELLQNGDNLRCLSGIQSWNPRYRLISVTVVRGKDLAAKDAPNILRRTASSDPYFIIEFNGNRFESEFKSQTLQPEWKCAPFDMGLVAEADTTPLKITLFDYDCLSLDDFMGMVTIPAHALYNLGPGQHTYWFLLGYAEKKGRPKEEVSGSILVHITIQEMISR